MAEVIWTEPALLDLNEIAKYIALDKVQAAQKLVRMVFDRIDLLQESPNSGRNPPELKDSRYREVIVGPCRIFYRSTGEKLYVLHVMRSEQTLRTYLLSDLDSSASGS